MRVDGTADAGGSKAWAGPRTWLLAAVAGWALTIWALGLFGLGGRIEVLPDDPSLLQRLPQAAKPGAERLGPLGQYSEIGARPLFSDDRRPQPFFINPEGERTLELRVFDGVGGEPPTAVAAPPQPGQPRPQPQSGTRQTRALVPPPASPPLPVPPAANRPAQQPPQTDETVPSPEAQAEAIRQRIEARRAQLLEQSKQPAPTKTP